MNAPVRIQTGARIHFGLLDVQPPFGGAGVMVDAPATEVIASPAERFDPGDVQPARIIAVAKRWSADHDDRMPPVQIRVPRRPPAHCGFGTGTQLALAVAEAIDRAAGGRPTPDQLIRWADRGKRSSVGSIGYFTGGLIAEDAADLNAARCNADGTRWRSIEAVPPAWRVALLFPRRRRGVAAGGIAGRTEQTLFDRLPPAPAAVRSSLRHLMTDAILPAARAGDFQSFASATTQFNRRCGELFATIQGGPYQPTAASTIHQLQTMGVPHAGQSSWGPGVFAWLPDADRAADLIRRWSDPATELTIAAVRNGPATKALPSVPLPGPTFKA